MNMHSQRSLSVTNQTVCLLFAESVWAIMGLQARDFVFYVH